MKAALGAILLVLMAQPALAASHAGEAPGLVWGIPFAGMLLSIAIFPLLAPRLWHHRMGLVALGWTLALVIPQIGLIGIVNTAFGTWHAILTEYLPFVTLLLALFTAGGGILIEGGPWGSPAGNTLLLAIGTALAGVMGTTGVSMVLIHPLLRANAHRTQRVHLVVFFIVLCANAGGATSPLGDPPLYLGFLHGVPFLWPVQNLTKALLLLAGPLLLAFFLLDTYLARREPRPAAPSGLRLRGAWNIALIGIVVACVLAQGVWHPGTWNLIGQEIEIERVLGMLVFCLVTVVSLKITPKSVRQGNLFSWEPMAEVGKLFAAIFITIGPVLAMLEAGADGPLAGLLRLTVRSDGEPSRLAYFWMTGILSAFLDNAPTYLVFFNLAGGDAHTLMTTLATTLAAVSAGSVFMGANTYIGNAPNFMVKAIAEDRGIVMPGFFGYMAWSGAVLIPLFLLITFIWY